MSVETDLLDALRSLLPKPPDTASREAKQAFSQDVSERAAIVLAGALRARGLTGVLPIGSGPGAGAERRMAGGIGAKRVDVTWATEQSGLLLALSVKSINFRDQRSRNFQKNLTNRRGDLLIEAVSLHRRFPYAVLAGMLFLDGDARRDDTPRRRSTFETASDQLRLFSGRRDPSGRDEQFERIVVVVFESELTSPSIAAYDPTDLTVPVELKSFVDGLLEMIVERNADFYELAGGQLVRKPQ